MSQPPTLFPKSPLGSAQNSGNGSSAGGTATPAEQRPRLGVTPTPGGSASQPRLPKPVAPAPASPFRTTAPASPAQGTGLTGSAFRTPAGGRRCHQPNCACGNTPAPWTIRLWSDRIRAVWCGNSASSRANWSWAIRARPVRPGANSKASVGVCPAPAHSKPSACCGCPWCHTAPRKAHPRPAPCARRSRLLRLFARPRKRQTAPAQPRPSARICRYRTKNFCNCVISSISSAAFSLLKTESTLLRTGFQTASRN